MYVIVPSLLHRAEYDCFQIELSKNYGVAEWREDVKSNLLKAGINNTTLVSLFSDTQVCLSYGSDVFLHSQTVSQGCLYFYYRCCKSVYLVGCQTELSVSLTISINL